MVLALLAHHHLDIDEEIFLFNVSFGNNDDDFQNAPDRYVYSCFLSLFFF